jgi:small subunit ribosomal protein S14
MATQSQIAKSTKENQNSPPESLDAAGNAVVYRGYIGEFGLCRICFRELANQGKISGVRKSSW